MKEKIWFKRKVADSQIQKTKEENRKEDARLFGSISLLAKITK